MRSDIDPHVSLSEFFQQRDELSDLNEVVSEDRSTSIISDALPEEMYSTVEVKSIRDPRLHRRVFYCIIYTVLYTSIKRSRKKLLFDSVGYTRL